MSEEKKSLNEVWGEDSAVSATPKALPGFESTYIRDVNVWIQDLKSASRITNAKGVSDGWHTFQELYDMRLALTVAAFKLLQHSGRDRVWRSKQHSNGDMFEGMFIVGYSHTQDEMITFHYHDEHWDLFSFADTVEKAPEWDGHTDKDVIQRLLSL